MQKILPTPKPKKADNFFNVFVHATKDSHVVWRVERHGCERKQIKMVYEHGTMKVPPHSKSIWLKLKIDHCFGSLT